jgi:hypothetical protein
LADPSAIFFPSGAPFDTRRVPFPGTSCASQAKLCPDLIRGIRPQIREIVLPGHPNPQQRWVWCFLSALLRSRLLKIPRKIFRIDLPWLASSGQLGVRLSQGLVYGNPSRLIAHTRLPCQPLYYAISGASVRLQRLRLACRSGARLIPILATRHGRARPGSACLWTDILNPL